MSLMLMLLLLWVCRKQVKGLQEELAELRAAWAADQEALHDAVDSARTVNPKP